MSSDRFSSIRTAVARCVSLKKEVLAAYVFGSAAAGRTRRDSDVDVAVLLSEGMTPRRIFKYRLTLMSDLGSALRRSDIDLVILNEAPPLLAHRILSKGKLVFERSPSARVRFQVMTANRYADLAPAFELYIRYLKKSVREGRIIG